MTRWSDILDIDNVLDTVGLARSNKATSAGAFFFGLGVGLIAGGVTAMLITPYNGNETREKLVKAGEDLGRTVSSKVNELKSSTERGREANLGGELQGSNIGGSAYSPGGTRIGSI